jgi:nitroreductase
LDTLEAITSRRSIRAYLDKPVSRETVASILQHARWAPSGTNTQPWQVAVLTGASKDRLTQALIDTAESGQESNPDYHYYPQEWRDPYKSRRKQIGMSMYQALGIGLKEIEKRKQAWYNNYRFFGAPVGLLFFIDSDLEQGSWMDLGMFLQNIMLAAQATGLATCPQASLAEFPDVVRQTLGLPATLQVACGMSLGYADPDAPVNAFELSREEVDSFTRWYE